MDTTLLVAIQLTDQATPPIVQSFMLHGPMPTDLCKSLNLSPQQCQHINVLGCSLTLRATTPGQRERSLTWKFPGRGPRCFKRSTTSANKSCSNRPKAKKRSATS